MEKRRGTKPQNQRTNPRSFNYVGFPDDLAIQNVQGRVGAREGPQAFWLAFKKLKGPAELHGKLNQSRTVEMSLDLEVNHQRASATVEELRRQFPKESLVVVGGGHDYAYSWIRGIKNSLKKGSKIGCINIDAHLDVRDYSPQMTSGSPFRRLIEEKILSSGDLIEFGIQSHCNAPELFNWCDEQKIKVVPFSRLRNGKSVSAFKVALAALRKKCDEVLISVDLDALSFAYAPGVSAPQAEGLSASELFQILEHAGSDKKVTSVGFFELSPPLDFQNYTARLAAQSAWHFLESALK